MPQSPGTRFGPYEIVAPLGAGGMGEVYRARDTRLGRDVAIKVLPLHLTANSEVRSRFQREAKTVSSLNHPHICTLHDVGREGDTDFLVMELVEGETLAERLSRGPLPAAELLKLGAQIADALDRAHRVGIVHRDLKPGNVMLTKSGAKLMDFGLARATGMAGGAGSGAGSVTMAALTQSPTVAAPLTAEGTIVGTFQYMSPEQLEGKEADARSDLWALGCVLYEMATGRRAFEGRSQASLITAIMSTQPPHVSQVAPLAPAGLDRLVRNCLNKDPEERVQTAHDVKLQLLGIAEGDSQVGAMAVAATPTTTLATPQRPNSARLAWAIATTTAVIAAGLAVLLVLLVPRGPKRPVQLSLTPPAGSQFTTRPSSAVISPDGHAVAFSAADTSGQFGIFVQPLEASDAIRVATSSWPALIFWSPDSKTIGFAELGPSKLKSVLAQCGSPVTLADMGAGRGATWSPQGVIVFAPRTQGPLLRISPAGGEPQQASWLDSTRNEASHRFPWFLPDGDHFLYASVPPGPDGYPIYVGSLNSRSVEKIMDAESAPTYAEPGYLLFRRSGKLMAQRFDAGRRKLKGEPFPLTDAGAPTDLDAEYIAYASNDGRLLYLVADAPTQELQWIDRSGVRVGTLTLPVGDWGRPTLSPDDRYAVVGKSDGLWRVDLTRSVAVRLTSGGDSNLNPVWSPDGKRIAYSIGSQGREQVFEMSSDGSDEPQLVPSTPDLFKWPDDWVAAGMIVMSIAEKTSRDLWILPPPGGGPPRPLIQTRFSEFDSRVSPDGRWIAYVSNEAGTNDIYIQSFPTPGHKVRVSSTGATRVWWMPGGDEVCFRAINGEVWSARLTRRGDDLDVGEPRVLFQHRPEVLWSDLAHDGQRILVNQVVPGAPKRRLRVVLDWTELVNR